MAIVRDPVARARAAATKVQAARLHLELESELGLADPADLPAGWEAQADEALSLLEARAGAQGWGDLRHPDAVVGETRIHGGRIRHGWTPSLSPAARRGEGAGEGSRPERVAPAGEPAPVSQRVSRRRGQAARTVRPRLAVARRHARRGRRFAAGSARAAGAGGWGTLAYNTLLGGIGLSFAYLLVTHSKGVDVVAGGVATGVRRLVSPNTDVLGGHSFTQAARAAGAARGVTGAQVTRQVTAANIGALSRVPGFTPAKTPAGRQAQSTVFGPLLPSATTMLP